jgi:SprT-like family protein
VISDRQLKHWYDKYNKAYFGGALPEAVVYWEPSAGNHAVTCPVFEVSDNVFEIKIDPALKGVTQFWKQTLLHEMIHVRIWKQHPKHQHGKLFQDEKDKLYAQGALRKLW